MRPIAKQELDTHNLRQKSVATIGTISLVVN